MLSLISRQPQASHTTFGNVIATAPYTILRIITFCSKRFNLRRFQSHHLPHTDMSQRDTHRTEHIFRLYTVSIPFGYGISRSAKFILLSVGKGKSLISILHRKLPLRFHSINCLVMEDTTIILKKRTILAAYINQHRGKPVTTRSTFTPQRRFGTAGITMTTATRIPRIDRAKTTSHAIATRTHIIVKPVTIIKATVVNTRHPICR